MNEDEILGEMVRDFTALGKCSKSEVRRRIQDYVITVLTRQNKELSEAQEEIAILRRKGGLHVGATRR